MTLRLVEPQGAPDSRLDLEQAFYDHAERVERFLMRLGHRRMDAEDLTSEAFLVAQEKVDKFDASRPVLPWLFGIAINLSKKQRRREWLKKWIALGLQRDATVEVSSPDMLRALVDREDQKRVHETLAAMPEKKRIVLVLRECEELSAKEIAVALDMPESSVYSALHYARKEFMRLYHQRLVLEGSR
jgi:RNA polymerase sigma-70 factor (ECF subfamily)